jgi:coenzyme F420 hydrogenase subunit beta
VSEAPDLQAIVRQGLCAGCGLCESIAGRERVEMAITSASYIRPRVRERLDEATLAKIRAACPGVTLLGPGPQQVAGKGVVHDIWGPIRSIHRGWSANAEIRFRSAAGGAMTALGCYLRESGKVDAVVHVRASVERPMETDAIVSRTPAELRSGAQSRYGPVAPPRHIERLLDEGVRFAVLAKPCDVAAIRNLARLDPRVERQIPYLITIFCGGVPTLQTAEKIAGYHGVAADEVSLFRWRGDGCRGRPT